MKMNECTSRTWTKLAEIPTDDLSIKGIAVTINQGFGEQFVEDVFDNIETAIKEGYIQVCDDGIIVWCS